MCVMAIFLCSDHEAEEIIDVTSVDPVVTLPYDERKVKISLVNTFCM